VDGVALSFLVAAAALVVAVPLVSTVRRRAVRRLFRQLAVSVAPERVALGGEVVVRAAVVPRAPLPVREIAVLVECEEFASESDAQRTRTART